MKKLAYLLAGTSLAAFMAVPAMAEGFASAKTGAVVKDFVVIDNLINTSDDPTDTTLGWTEIFSMQLKSGNDKYMYISPSLECVLVTQTLVKSKNHGKDTEDLTTDTSSAMSTVQVRVKVDGNHAYPWAGGAGVKYCEREQELEAMLGGIFVDCLDANGDGVTDVLSECSLIEEEIRLLLGSTTATTFNFVYGPMTSGVHTVSVEAKIHLTTEAQEGSSMAQAGIGRGTLIVQEGRLSNDQGPTVIFE